MLLFGAGIPGGQVIGRTDAGGDAPVERPVTPPDLATVLYHKLGIDPDTKYERPTAGQSVWSTAATRLASWLERCRRQPVATATRGRATAFNNGFRPLQTGSSGEWTRIDQPPRFRHR